MKNTLRQVFHSPKFVTGFSIFMVILVILFVYPLINPGDPLEMIGVGTFAKPGTYVSMYDAVKSPYETLRLSDAADKRIAASLKDEDRVAMVEYFNIIGVDISELDISDTEQKIKDIEYNIERNKIRLEYLEQTRDSRIQQERFKYDNYPGWEEWENKSFAEVEAEIKLEY